MKKCPVTKVINGSEVAVQYNEDGTEESRTTYEDGVAIE
jgi:hypothetical protein